MTAISVCLVLALLMGLLMKTNGLNPGSALVCVIFGLVLSSTQAGPTIQGGLDSAGNWLWNNVRTL